MRSFNVARDARRVRDGDARARPRPKRVGQRGSGENQCALRLQPTRTPSQASTQTPDPRRVGPDRTWRSATLGDELAARQSLANAVGGSYQISEARYREGVDSYLGLLDAQRELYAAQQGLVAARVARATNFVTLYKVLGGGVLE